MENNYLPQSTSTVYIPSSAKIKVDYSTKRTALIMGALSILGNHFAPAPFKRKRLAFAPVEHKAKDALALGLQSDFHASCNDIASAARKVYNHHSKA